MICYFSCPSKSKIITVKLIMNVYLQNGEMIKWHCKVTTVDLVMFRLTSRVPFTLTGVLLIV